MANDSRRSSGGGRFRAKGHRAANSKVNLGPCLPPSKDGHILAALRVHGLYSRWRGAHNSVSVLLFVPILFQILHVAEECAPVIKPVAVANIVAGTGDGVVVFMDVTMPGPFLQKQRIRFGCEFFPHL